MRTNFAGLHLSRQFGVLVYQPGLSQDVGSSVLQLNNSVDSRRVEEGRCKYVVLGISERCATVYTVHSRNELLSALSDSVA